MEKLPQDAKLVAITTTSCSDIIGVFKGTNEDGSIKVQNPQIFIVHSNSWVPYAAIIEAEERTFDIPAHACAIIGEPIKLIERAYKDDFAIMFEDLDTNFIKQELKARADLAEQASPVHGEVESKGGIILKS